MIHNKHEIKTWLKLKAATILSIEHALISISVKDMSSVWRQKGLSIYFKQ